MKTLTRQWMNSLSTILIRLSFHLSSFPTWHWPEEVTHGEVEADDGAKRVVRQREEQLPLNRRQQIRGDERRVLILDHGGVHLTCHGIEDHAGTCTRENVLRTWRTSRANWNEDRGGYQRPCCGKWNEDWWIDLHSIFVIVPFLSFIHYCSFILFSTTFESRKNWTWKVR